MPRTVEYNMEVRFRSSRGFDLDGFLDMLRYDHATVESWRKDGDNYVVAVRRINNDFTNARWLSFGIETSLPRSVFLT